MNNILAQGKLTNPVLGNLGSQTGESYFQKFVPATIGMAFLIGAIIFFFTLVIGAIQWISSGGDKQGLESARGKITNAMIGIILLFAAFALVNLIEIFFKINILSLDIGALKIQ